MTKEEAKKAKAEAKAKKKEEKLAAKQAKIAAKEAKKKGKTASAVETDKPAAQPAKVQAQANESKVKPAETAGPAVAEQKAKPASKNYHIVHRQDGKWQVKFAKGEKATKLFDTQEEAIAYAKKLAANQNGSITIHKKDGSIRKQRY